MAGETEIFMDGCDELWPVAVEINDELLFGSCILKGTPRHRSLTSCSGGK